MHQNLAVILLQLNFSKNNFIVLIPGIKFCIKKIFFFVSPSPSQRSLNFTTSPATITTATLDETDDVASRRDDLSSLSSTSSDSSQGCPVTPSTASTASTTSCGDGILVDLLETEVDSLKAQLEKTQNDLVSFA